MRAQHQPMAIRIQAASALFPYTHPSPRPTNSVPRCTIVIGGLGPGDHGLSPEDPEQIVGNSQSKSDFASNNPHPQSESPGPSNTEMNSYPQPLPDYSTPPTPA